MGFYFFKHAIVTKLSVFHGWSLDTVFNYLSFPLLSINPISISFYFVRGTLIGLSLTGWETAYPY